MEEEIDGNVNGAPAPASCQIKHLFSMESHSAKLFRVLDYQAQALAAPDALDACMGAVTAGLIRTAFGIEEAVDTALARPITADEVKQLQPAIDVQVRVVKQVMNLAQYRDKRSAVSMPPSTETIKSS